MTVCSSDFLGPFFVARSSPAPMSHGCCTNCFTLWVCASSNFLWSSSSSIRCRSAATSARYPGEMSNDINLPASKLGSPVSDLGSAIASRTNCQYLLTFWRASVALFSQDKLLGPFGAGELQSTRGNLPHSSARLFLVVSWLDPRFDIRANSLSAAA
jgi:hypothetical protein